MIPPEAIEVAARALAKLVGRQVVGSGMRGPGETLDARIERYVDRHWAYYKDDAKASLAAAAPLLVAGEREARLNVSQLAETLADEALSICEPECVDPVATAHTRSVLVRKFAAAIRARANIDATPAETRRAGE